MTREERDNNPLGIDRTHIAWEGMAPVQSDPRFINWISPEYCYRAASRIIRDHYAQGRTTVDDIIAAWAPSSENNTGAYQSDVATRMGVVYFQTLNITRVTGDASQLLALLKAMTFHENGECIYTDATIQKGMDMEVA